MSKTLEMWPSGRKKLFTKPSWEKSHREFESRPFRILENKATIKLLLIIFYEHKPTKSRKVLH